MMLIIGVLSLFILTISLLVDGKLWNCDVDLIPNSFLSKNDTRHMSLTVALT
jgi:hypothetical protein